MATDHELFEALDNWTDEDLPAKVARLIAAGANPNARRDDDGATPLLALAEVSASGPATYRALLAAGADPMLGDAVGNTVLHVLASQGSAIKEIAELLKTLPVDLRNAAGETPLHLAAGAAYWDAIKLVKRLVEKHGADPRALDGAGREPVERARGDTKKWLLSKTRAPMSADEAALLAAVGEGNVAAARALLERGVSPCVVDTSDKSFGPNSAGGVAAIHVAMNRRLPHELAESVLAAKIDPNTRDIANRTPLHHVIDKNTGPTRRALVDRLLALGADVQLADDWGRTPVFELLSFWEATDELELLDLLRGAGARLDHAGRGGDTLVDVMFERVQRFHETNDKVGFVALFQRLVDLGVTTGDPRYERGVATWLATTGVKYGARPNPDIAPAAPKAPPDLRGIDLAPCGELQHESASFELDGKQEDVALFDWLALESAEDDDRSNEASQVWEYHIRADVEERVKAYQLVPFGVVGMTGSLDSYEEISTLGTLFVDVTRAEGGDAPVVFVPNDGPGETRDLRVSFRGLLATLRRDED